MRLFSKLADIWRHEELRNKIVITLGLILVYRIGSFIVLPGVNPDALSATTSGLGGCLHYSLEELSQEHLFLP